ncbi:MAG: tetratricopeptide repeat protein [Treponema sp.]|jgi:tetratricopeptide (TPR) repeat protein|nr:tetratricopeptide repeat protein [Treponema sp.]
MQNKNEKSAPGGGANDASSIGDGINEFIQKHRKPLFVSAGVILLILILCIAALSVMDILRAGAISAVEEFGSRYEALRPSITEEYSANDAAQLLAEIEAFTQKKSTLAAGYAGGKAWSIIGSIHSDKKDWAASETAWAAAARAGKKTYLAPLAFFNAGAAAEEQGKTQEAIEYYTSSLASSADFSGAPRAQFAIGRLRETLHEDAAAIDAYRAVISGWPHDRVWTSLAHSRIIALEVE